MDSFTLEMTFLEDSDGNGWSNGQDDSRRLDMRFGKADFNNQWTLISAPLSSLRDLGRGGNGFFEDQLDGMVFVISNVVGANPASIAFDLDSISFTGSGPLEQK